MMTKLMVLIFIFIFIIFTIVGIIGEETENDDKIIKFFFKLIKILAFIGTTYSLIVIYLISIM